MMVVVLRAALAVVASALLVGAVLHPRHESQPAGCTEPGMSQYVHFPTPRALHWPDGLRRAA